MMSFRVFETFLNLARRVIVVEVKVVFFPCPEYKRNVRQQMLTIHREPRNTAWKMVRVNQFGPFGSSDSFLLLRLEFRTDALTFCKLSPIHCSYICTWFLDLRNAHLSPQWSPPRLLNLLCVLSHHQVAVVPSLSASAGGAWSACEQRPAVAALAGGLLVSLLVVW